MEAEYEVLRSKLSKLNRGILNISSNAGNGHQDGDEEKSTITGLKKELVTIQKEHLEKEQSWKEERFKKDLEISRLNGDGQRLRLELDAKGAELKAAEEVRNSEVSKVKKDMEELGSELEKFKELADKEKRAEVAKVVQRLDKEKAEAQQKLQEMAKSMKAVEAQRKVALDENLRLGEKVTNLESRISEDAKKLKMGEEAQSHLSSEIAGLKEDLEDVTRKEEELHIQVQALSASNASQSAEIEDLKAQLEQERRDGEKRLEEDSKELRNRFVEQLEQVKKTWMENPIAGFSGFQGQGSGQPTSKPVHEEDPQNPLVCLCTRSFENVVSLKNHVRYENGCYPCPHCGKEFKTSGQLTKHLDSKKHARQSRSSPAKRPRRSGMEVETDNDKANGNGDSEDDDTDDTDREVTNDNEEGELNEDEQVDVEGVSLSDISVGEPESME